MDSYLDASVLLPRLIREPRTPAVDKFLLGWTDRLIIGTFAAAEVASAVSRLVRTGRISTIDGVTTLADFDAWRGARATSLDVAGADVRLAEVWVRRFNLMLRAPDALHAAICQRLGLTLVSLDMRLANAGRAMGVTVIVPTP